MVAEEEVTGRAPRVVLDTNVAVSALLFRGGRLAWLREAWTAVRVVPIVSRETVAELVRVLAYPKFGLSAEETKSALAIYMEHAQVAEVRGSLRVPQCRDEDDRMFLRLAYAARADALVSGDAELLAVAGKSRIPIIRPEALKQRLEGPA